MAQSGFTPISIYYSTTASAVPTAANLVPGELAINTNDGKLYYEDSSGVVRVLASKSTGTVGGSNTQVQFNNSGSLGGSSGLTWDGSFLTTSSIKNTALTSGRVTYAGASGLLTDSANLLYSGTDLTVYGVRVGRGAGASATNTAVGASALNANTTGIDNTALGDSALLLNSTGTQNTAIGRVALANTTASFNTGLGFYALALNTSGASNTAVGVSALQSNTTASQNTAVGYQAGYSNISGANLVAIGYQAGYTSNASNNTFVGYYSGQATTGILNTFLGVNGVGYLVSSGTKNTIIGGYSGNQGGLDIRTASNYIVLSDGDGNPRMWMDGDGTPYIPRSYSLTTSNGANLFIESSGAFYRSTSSIKYKRDVQNAAHGLAKVLELRSVTYRGKGAVDGETVFGGLIAEEVHAAGLTEFVQYAEDGTPDSLAYGNMVSLCVKAIQELKAEFDAYKATHP